MSIRDRIWGTLFGGGRALGRDVRRAVTEGIRGARQVDRRVHTVPAQGPERGRVLLGYILRGFFEDPEGPVIAGHTQYWESMEIARAWSERGYRVDVVDNYNYGHRPEGRYDVVIGARMILERFANRTAGNPRKVLHADTSHWLTNNSAQLRRLNAIRDRRGVSLKPRKLVEPNVAIEVADVAAVLGNRVTLDTYGFAPAPKHPLCISTLGNGGWTPKDMDAVRRSWVWFGSQGLAHKGLDLVLEAFAELPAFTLYVCGPIHEEADFTALYERELRETESIKAVGWVDVRGPEWRRIVEGSVGLVFPSCAEGQSGSVIKCMHDGLIPVVTAATGVDVPPRMGRILESDTVEGIRNAVREVADRPAEELEAMARACCSYAETHHTRDAFGRRYRELAREIDPGGDP